MPQFAFSGKWSTKIADADAFIFVTPEYNHGTPPSLINALDYLVHEWAYKPVLHESVAAPLFAHSIDEKGVFNASEIQEASAKMMLDALVKWTSALAAMRG